MNDIAVQAKTELVIAPEQTEFTDVQLAALRHAGVENAPPGDVAVFFHQAKRTGLDPFAKQIYMIGRKTKVDNNYQMRYTIQIGIDGYRLNGRRAAAAAGDQLATEGPFWRGETGDWDDVWLDHKTPPLAAKFTIIRNGQPFTGVAMYHEYVQTYFDTDSKTHVPNSMWSKMPANQLAKCAEVAAWRRAYPDDFSGLVYEDTAQIIDETGAPVRVRSERGGRGVEALRARAKAATADNASEDDKAAEVRRKWLGRMFQLLNDEDGADCRDRDDQLIVIGACAGLPIGSLEHRDSLTDEQLRAVVTTLNDWNKKGQLAAKVTDILNTAAIAEAEAQAESSAATTDPEGK